MKTKCCHICGEVKPKDEFVRYKCYMKQVPKKAVWCKDCLKMHHQMVKQQEKEQLLATSATFLVNFS